MTRCHRPLSLADHFSASHHWSTPPVTGLSLTIFLGSLTEPAPSSSRHKSDRSPPVGHGFYFRWVTGLRWVKIVGFCSSGSRVVVWGFIPGGSRW
ncbi:hypothetical protein FCV25MIE_07139 [Fagus crenata]